MDDDEVESEYQLLLKRQEYIGLNDNFNDNVERIKYIEELRNKDDDGKMVTIKGKGMDFYKETEWSDENIDDKPKPKQMTILCTEATKGNMSDFIGKIVTRNKSFVKNMATRSFLSISEGRERQFLNSYEGHEILKNTTYARGGGLTLTSTPL